MILRILVVAASLAVLGGAGYASWYGVGATDRDTGPGSVRTTSAGGAGFARVRVK